MRDAVRRKRPELWRSGEWLLHHDNAPAHTALSVRQFLTKNGMTTASHTPYSPDLAPCDFFLFPRMKRDLKGKRFQNMEEVREKTTEALKATRTVLNNGKSGGIGVLILKGYFEGD